MWIHHIFIYMILSVFWNDIDWKDVEPKTLSLTLTLILTWYELFEWVLYFIWKHPFPWSHKSLLWSTFLCTNFFYPIESLWPFSWYVVVCWFFSNPREKTKNRKLNYTAFWLFLQTFLTQADILHASLIYSRRFLIYTSPYTFILVFLVIYFHK